MKARIAIVVAIAAAVLFSQSGLSPARTQVNSIDGSTYIWIPPGSFVMGCSPGDSECDKLETPAHQVLLSGGFWIGQSLVTQEAYQRVTGKSPGYFKRAKFPVESVSWLEAQSYCEATGMRLPSEAEWEYAARAGDTSRRYGALDEIAWYGINSAEKTHEVMQKRANAWKLYDTLGEVWEWTGDWFAAYSASPLRDPQGPASGKVKVVRGGSWGNGPTFVRVSARSGNEPENRSNVVGFRCAGNN